MRGFLIPTPGCWRPARPGSATAVARSSGAEAPARENRAEAPLSSSTDHGLQAGPLRIADARSSISDASPVRPAERREAA